MEKIKKLGLPKGSEIVIKQIGLLEFHLFGLLPTCDKDFGDIIKLKENER